jgi:ATP-dependent DNA helicase RecG
MYTEKELQDILRKLLDNPIENETFELKTAENDYDFKKIGQYFSALSNEANLKHKECAWLIFGVSDNGKIVGTQYRADPKKLSNLKKELADKTNDRITFQEIYPVDIGGKRVLMFQIPPAHQGIPTSFEGHYYGRDGESQVALSKGKYDNICSQSSLPDWSTQIVEDAGIDDLDPEAVRVARNNYLTKNPDKADEMREWSDLEFLNKAKITIKGKITNTALLLLGKPESEVYLNPAEAKIRWILKDSDGIELDHYIATCPFILAVDQILSKIRNLRYRYLQPGTLFPTEVDQYDQFNIREAINNAIGHQDYRQNGRITVIERSDSLIFSNRGSFIPGSVEAVIRNNAPEERYRNKFLIEAMRNLNMVETIGNGIRKMFMNQRKKLFPLPDYDLSDGRVVVTITGRVLDVEYARILAQNSELSLNDIILLDKVQKRILIGKAEAEHLKRKKLIEGRRPNYFISREVSEKTGVRVAYTKNKGLDKQYYLDLILRGITQHGELSRKEIEGLLMSKLPDILSEKQKEKKIDHLIEELRKSGKIYPERRGRNSYWYLA